MITLTEAAAHKIKRLIQKRGATTQGIRVGVKTTGCSGLAYVLEFLDSPGPDDVVVHSQECTVYVDPKSLVYVQGITIDYVRQGLNEGFDFKNPNERDRCGCGESFRV